MLENALHYLFFGMLISVPIGWAISVLVLNLLKTRHPDVFENLGEPSVLPSRKHREEGFFSYFSSQLRTGGYLYSLKWMLLDDQITEITCWVWLVFHLAFCVVFLTIIILGVIVENNLL